MTAEDPKEFGDDFPEAPTPVHRRMPVATLAIIAGLAALVILLILAE